MFKRLVMRIFYSLLCLMCIAATASGQATSDQVRSDLIQIRTAAEVELRLGDVGHPMVKLVPADRVVPGDNLIYTLEIRNAGSTAVAAPVVIEPLPAHMQYVARSAAGPGTDISYSLDGGLTFGQPENLQLRGSDGLLHPARAADYTHIRWQFRKALKPNSIAFARFRAVVK